MLKKNGFNYRRSLMSLTMLYVIATVSVKVFFLKKDRVAKQTVGIVQEEEEAVSREEHVMKRHETSSLMRRRGSPRCLLKRWHLHGFNSILFLCPKPWRKNAPSGRRVNPRR